MKILMFSRVKIFDDHLRGGARRFFELYNQLNKNHHVEMCTVDDVADYENRKICGDTFPAIIFNKQKPISSINAILKATKERVRQIKNAHYDKIIVFGIPSAIVLSLFNVKNIYLFLRDDLIGYRKVSMGYPEKSLGIKNRVYLWFLNLIEGISIERCHVLVVQCKYDLLELKKRHKGSSEQLERKAIIQINNVNPSWIIENSDTTAMQLEGEGHFKVGFIGNFNNEQKGNQIFLKAISEHSFPECDFYIAGTGKNEKLFREQYKNPNIHFCGWISNACAFIKACDLIVVPSLADSCPNTVMEALYCGIPVIGSNRGGIPDILNNSEWIFEPDYNIASESISRVLSQDKLEDMKRMQNNRKHELEFDWARRIVETVLSK